MVRADDVQQFISEEAFWYSTIELAPGVFSPGLNIPSIALTRAALKAIPLAGLKCLDVGTVEGVVPVLMKRRRARAVVGYDRINWSRKAHFVMMCYGVDYRYVAGFNYADFQVNTLRSEMPLFDLIVFSGVLYHMFDPLGGLLRTRSMVRQGGLVIVETSALMNDVMAIFFNAEACIIPPPNYFVPSLACLEYLLRLCRLVPLDFIHAGHGGEGVHPDHTRVCVVCRAVDMPQVFKSGAWDKHLIRDYRDYLNWNDTATDLPPVPFDALGNTLVHREDGSLDLLASVRAAEQYAITPRQIVLHLEDVN